jgi:carbamate kinase
MRVVIALGGNALLRRGQPMSERNQRENVKSAAKALAQVAGEHTIVITHGNGPQVGLLALQSAAYKDVEPYPLDVLGAESEGMIGYLIEQELGNILPYELPIATILTQIEVDPRDPAFQHPSKPIGPTYSREEAERLSRERGWVIAPDNDRYRRVVPSPFPKHIFELKVIEFLVKAGVVVICAGGGGIPTVYRLDGSLMGVEAVIDKDRAGALLARELQADAYLMLTDVKAVYTDWGKPGARAIRRASPDALEKLSFVAGSMGPKVEAACDFVRKTGGMAAIGALEDAAAMLHEEAGTILTNRVDGIEWYELAPDSEESSSFSLTYTLFCSRADERSCGLGGKTRTEWRKRDA